MRKVISFFFALFPSGFIKDVIRQYYYNSFVKNDFRIYRSRKCWIVKYPDVSLKFSPEIFPYHVLKTNYIFLHHFPEKEIDLFVDAGAFIGTFLLYAKKKHGNIQAALAFEPDPNNRKCLDLNILLNGCEETHVHTLGLWNKRDTLNFYIGNQLASSVFSGDVNGGKISIEVDSLDNLLPAITGKRIFIKMNIEGAEIMALDGCRELIRKNKVHMAIAADHLVDGKLTCPLVEEKCRHLGMSVSTFRSGRYITVYASNEHFFDNPVTS